MKWQPKWRDALDIRLREWAKYHRLNNDPGVGYDRVNLLKKIMKPIPGESVDVPRDWSPEERMDHALQMVHRLDPAMAYAVTVPALWPFPRGRKSQYWADRWNYAMRQAEPGWRNLGWRTFDGYRKEGRALLTGMLAEHSGHARLYALRVAGL